jgi:transposase
VDRDSEVAIRKRVSRAKLLEFFAGLPPCLIGIEACPTAHHWSWKLQALGRTVRLMPPSYVKPYLKRSKNDANDAAAICEAVTRLASNSAIDCPSTPAAPWLAFTRLKASQTSRLGILNGFALSTGSSCFQLA